jgi:hypothetical protein
MNELLFIIKLACIKYLHKTFDEAKVYLSSDDIFILYKMHTEEVKAQKELEKEMRELKYGSR